MKVFVTGATGWVGSAVVAELLRFGHEVAGLARSDAGAEGLAAAGASVVRGSLEDVETLRAAAARADAVVHTAFNHDFSRFVENAQQDRQVILALGAALAGSDRPLLATSGLSGLPRGATESDFPAPGSPRKSDAAAQELRDRGVRASTVRLAPSVHGVGDHGFVPILVRTARETGVSAYLGSGANAWAGVHRLDAARVYRLALEQGASRPIYHAVADEAVPFRSIAEVIGRKLGLPVEPRSPDHFAWFANMVRADMAASSERTREALGWRPSSPGLLEDLEEASYYVK